MADKQTNSPHQSTMDNVLAAQALMDKQSIPQKDRKIAYMVDGEIVTIEIDND